MTETQRRIRNRLDRHIYEAPMTFSLTAASHLRHHAFADPEMAKLGIECLAEASAHFAFTPLAYCFMPDHVHLLMLRDQEGNVIEFMKRFKQLLGFRYKKARGRDLWQKGYWDHIVRRDEDIAAAANYIFANPVRAGLVSEVVDYPYSGGLYFEGGAGFSGGTRAT